MKLSDYVAQFLADQGIEYVFGVTGGAVVHVFDSIEKTPGIKPVFNHHEQASALAAQAYARIRNGLGAACFTTGPGGTNAITGVTAAWLDSIPVIYISGQTRLAHTTNGRTIRQYGNQQLNIVSLVEPITKYAVMIDDPQTIRYHLEKAVAEATTGRPGPVWLDIPLDIQWADVDPIGLPAFVRQESRNTSDTIKEEIEEVVRMLNDARRPLILAGYGIRLAGADKELDDFLKKTGIPVVTSWNASDLIDNSRAQYIGRPGIFGQRGANFAVQNCDLLLSIGSHLSVPLTGSMFDAFAPMARKVVVDVDEMELEHETVPVDVSIKADARVFLQSIVQAINGYDRRRIAGWNQQCLYYKQNYNVIPKEWWEKESFVDPYVLMDVLSDELNDADVISVDGGGTTNQIAFQTLRFKKGQRVVISAGLCSMGTGLPESIGLSFSRKKQRVICLCGDGSIQFNIQEFQTVVHHQLPIKMFILNNGGYLSIRQTQDGFLDSHYIGSESGGGLSLPDVKAIAESYNIEIQRIENHISLREQVRKVIEGDGPIICEVLVDPNQEIVPRLGFDRQADGTGVPRPLEDMYPYLKRDEFIANMVREQI